MECIQASSRELLLCIYHFNLNFVDYYCLDDETKKCVRCDELRAHKRLWKMKRCCILNKLLVINKWHIYTKRYVWLAMENIDKNIIAVDGRCALIVHNSLSYFGQTSTLILCLNDRKCKCHKCNQCQSLLSMVYGPFESWIKSSDVKWTK